MPMEQTLTAAPIVKDAPPRSITTGPSMAATLAGVTAGCAIVFWLRPGDAPEISALIVMACLAVPCALVEVFVNRAPEASGLDFARRSLSVPRVMRKLAALWAILAALLAAYAALPVYEAELYRPFHWLLGNFGSLFLIASIPYVALVDTFQKEPEDALASLGGGLLAFSFRPTAQEVNYLLGWVVKGFFLPLMFSYLAGQIDDIRGMMADAGGFTVSLAYDLSYSGIFLVDLIVAAVGYVTTMRLLGTDIRSVEPTLKGWAVAVMCYEPFWALAYGNYLAYGHDRPWGVWLADYPVAYALWAAMIIAVLLVYGWVSLCFGIRFSNLTHRGIITSGPYRWTKHPGYIAKNISWWLVSIPFLPADGSVLTARKLCLMLGLVNLVYYLRAKTEEQHLSQDPVYRDYAEYIRRNGIFRFLAR